MRLARLLAAAGGLEEFLRSHIAPLKQSQKAQMPRLTLLARHRQAAGKQLIHLSLNDRALDKPMLEGITRTHVIYPSSLEQERTEIYIDRMELYQ